jgi:hypothetical protein
MAGTLFWSVVAVTLMAFCWKWFQARGRRSGRGGKTTREENKEDVSLQAAGKAAE